MAFGAMMALARKAREGGSWHVQVSLARTGHWLKGLGRLDDGLACPDPSFADVGDLLDEMRLHRQGRITYVRTPPASRQRRHTGPARPSPLGTHAPVWPV